MNDVTGRQPEARRQARFAGFAAAELSTNFQQFRSGGPVDGAVNAAAAQQRTICRIDDGIDRQGGDIGFDCPNSHRCLPPVYDGSLTE